jgi:hypothetical protein
VSERKPPGVSWESWVDKQIREAQDKGEFDDLPGHGPTDDENPRIRVANGIELVYDVKTFIDWWMLGAAAPFLATAI